MRPTIPRITILQIVESAGLQALSAEDVFQRTIERGTQVGMGTVYRVLQQFEERGMLLREWSANRKTLYRLRPDGAADQVLYMVCSHSGRRLRVVDPLLHERLRVAAHNLGVSLVGRQVLIEVDGAGSDEPDDGRVASAGRRKAFQLGDLTTEPA